jgi:hypothetical protein
MFKLVPHDFGYDDLSTETVNGKRHYVTPTGVRYPSITTVLSKDSKDYIMEWRARVGEEEANRVARFASGRGNGMHTAAERYIRGDDWIWGKYPKKKPMPHVKRLFQSIRGILDDDLTDVFCQERALYSDFLKVAGRVDLVGKFRGRNSVVDFKTSKRVKSRDDIHNYFMQACAYSIMYEERTGIGIPQIVVIMAIDDSDTPQLFIEKRDDWFVPLTEAIINFNK